MTQDDEVEGLKDLKVLIDLVPEVVFEEDTGTVPFIGFD